MSRIEISQGTIPRKPDRHRKRLGLTVDPATIEKLKGLVADGECENVSRAIDFVTEFFCQNRSAVQVNFSDPALRAAATKAALQAGKKSAGELLEALAVNFLK